MPDRPAAPARVHAAAGIVALASALAPAQPERTALYSQDFAHPGAAAEFVCTDGAAWRLDRGSLWQSAPSRYAPAHRSPANFALLRGFRVGSFELEAELMQTGREYGHRDMCIVFAFQDPEHFCYAHLASHADEHAHGVFVVNGAARAPVTSERSAGVDWGREAWHKVRIEFDSEAGDVRVFFDGEPVLASDDVPFKRGYVGFGTFDDEGRIDSVRLRSDDFEEAACAHFEPMPAGEVDRSVRFEHAEDRVRVSLGDDHFADYVYDAPIHPYLAPVHGPGGVRMTRAFPMEEFPDEAHDHSHHTGLWWAHGDINGVDTWHEGDMRPLGEPRVTGSTVSASFSVDGPDGPTGVTVVEALTFAETPCGDRQIDAEITLSAPDDAPLVLGDTKEGAMAIRTHPALRLPPDPSAGVTHVTGVARNSEGVAGRDVWGKRAAWIDYSGVIDGVPLGVAIFDHPSNPRFPTWWHARDYGLVAANPFGQSDFEGGERGRGQMVVKAGGSVSFRYRFLFHRFDSEGARIADAYAQLAGPAPESGAEDR